MAIALAGLTGALLVGTEGAAAPPSADPRAAVHTALKSGGKGSAKEALSVDVTKASATADAGAADDRGALGIDGLPTGTSLPSTSVQGTKPAAATGQARAGGPNAGAGDQARTLAPFVNVDINFDGVNQTQGGGAQPPDVNAAVGRQDILEPVNRRVSVFNKNTGVLRCTNTLAGWLNLPNTTNVFDPRALYDNLNDRFILVATTIGMNPPTLFVAASQTGDPCRFWFSYTVTFAGPLLPPGTLLDYPYLGQDQVAILMSTNNFNPGYINSTAWSIPKAPVYAGMGFTFPVFPVAFSTTPSTVGGIPIGPTANSYFISAVNGVGYNLYRMTNSGNPALTTLVLQAVVGNCFDPFLNPIGCAFNRPTRRVVQCGTPQTLDPLDGRIVWTPSQAVNSPYIWFTHGIDIAGFPGVRYGAIDVLNNIGFVAVAFKSGSSDDFNPSISTFEVAPNSFYITLNWAYTDAPNCVNTSVTVDGVVPGGGFPNLLATSLDLINGNLTNTNFRFGDYSSVHIDPTAAPRPGCTAGQTALVAQQYFGPTQQWHTRLARVSFC